MNKMKSTLISVVVKAPGFGDRRKETLGGLAVLTGGQVIAEELGLELKNTTLDMLGHAGRVIIDKNG